MLGHDSDLYPVLLKTPKQREQVSTQQSTCLNAETPTALCCVSTSDSDPLREAEISREGLAAHRWP